MSRQEVYMPEYLSGVMWGDGLETTEGTARWFGEHICEDGGIQQVVCVIQYEGRDGKLSQRNMHGVSD